MNQSNGDLTAYVLFSEDISEFVHAMKYITGPMGYNTDLLNGTVDVYTYIDWYKNSDVENPLFFLEKTGEINLGSLRNESIRTYKNISCKEIISRFSIIKSEKSVEEIMNDLDKKLREEDFEKWKQSKML